mgnify:CR=1 FL=1
MKPIKQPHYILLFCLLSSIIPLLAVDVPRGLAWAPSLSGLIFFGLYFLTFDNKPTIPWKTIGFCGITFTVAALSLLWASNYEDSLKQVVKLALVLPPQILLFSVIGSLSKQQLKPYMHIFSYGVAIGAVYLCFELLTKGMIFNIIRGNELDSWLNLSEFNRASAIMVLYSFGAIAILKSRMQHPLSFLIILLPILAALFISNSQSAQISLILGGLFYFLFPYRSKIAWIGMRVVILALMLSAPFFISYIYQNFAADIQDIPLMAKGYAGHRLEIWDYISRHILQQPLLGYGIEMTRETVFDSKQIFESNNTVLHPHNFAIQIWVEFGMVGILIAMAMMNALLSTIQNKFSTVSNYGVVYQVEMILYHVVLIM